jgi:hypothetical protein
VKVKSIVCDRGVYHKRCANAVRAFAYENGEKYAKENNAEMSRKMRNVMWRMWNYILKAVWCVSSPGGTNIDCPQSTSREEICGECDGGVGILK